MAWNGAARFCVDDRRDGVDPNPSAVANLIGWAEDLPLLLFTRRGRFRILPNR